MSNYHIVDKRNTAKGKNLPNRKRFIDKARKQIRDSLRKGSSSPSGGGEDDNLTNTNGKNISIDSDGINEPTFDYDRSTGTWDYILPGNKNFIPGDKVPKPATPGGGKGGASNSDEEVDDNFVFSVSHDEYFDIIFEDLELPDFVKLNEKETTIWKRQRAGHTKSGAITNIDLVRTMRNSLGRRIALAYPLDRQITELETHIAQLPEEEQTDQLQYELTRLKERRQSVAYIDPVDVRYKRFQRVPIPNTQAVMFCLMDTSFSMGSHEKEVAKRFFLVTYEFLKRTYAKVHVRFIRHTDRAKEVNEHDFFYSTESGGTVISSGLLLMEDIIKQDYNDTWNMYCVQATDGDNDYDDNDRLMSIFRQLLPKFQYYVYNEIAPDIFEPSPLFDRHTVFKAMMEIRATCDNLCLVRMNSVDDVVPAFRKVFAKKR